jgi:hypothetical protein
VNKIIKSQQQVEDSQRKTQCNDGRELGEQRRDPASSSGCGPDKRFGLLGTHLLLYRRHTQL